MTDPSLPPTGASQPGAPGPRYDVATDIAAPEAGPDMAPAGTAPVTVSPIADVIARPARPTGSRGTTILLAVGAAVAIGGVAFAAGRLTAPAQAPSGTFQPGGGGLAGQGAGAGQGPGGQAPGDGQGFPGRSGLGGLGGMTISGTVTAATSDSITVKLESGTEVTIPVDGDTAYHTATAASASAVGVGSSVQVTPGATPVDPTASFDPQASQAPGAGPMSFGPATDVTVVEP